jgi:hypothetical protein
MFATYDDLAGVELRLSESRRKVAAQAKLIEELRQREQPTGLAERFMARLEQALALQAGERDAIFARLRAEIA